VRQAALFDVDRTLVTVNTARLYVRWRMQRQEASLLDYVQMSRVLLQYAFGTLDAELAARAAFQTVRGYSEALMRAECRAWYDRVVRPYISLQGRREVERCQSAGQLCAILSASTPYLTEPLAEELGIEHVICTRLEVAEGAFTGGWEAPLCYGPGKVQRARAWAEIQGVDLARSAFYTDSVSDLPMLEAVGWPRVVNPDPRLRLVALCRRYPVESWK
jgi:HAD superfamily hydrolase (TIGR01490 family)